MVCILKLDTESHDGVVRGVHSVLKRDAKDVNEVALEAQQTIEVPNIIGQQGGAVALNCDGLPDLDVAINLEFALRKSQNASGRGLVYQLLEGKLWLILVGQPENCQ